MNQSLTDRMVEQVRFFADRPELGKSVFSMYSDEPKEKVEAFMGAHPFLLHFESVLALRGLLPRKQYNNYLVSMERIFSEAPVLLEWMKRTDTDGTMWSSDLWGIAARSQANPGVPRERRPAMADGEQTKALLLEEYKIAVGLLSNEATVFWQRHTLYLAVTTALLGALAIAQSADGGQGWLIAGAVHGVTFVRVVCLNIFAL